MNRAPIKSTRSAIAIGGRGSMKLKPKQKFRDCVHKPHIQMELEVRVCVLPK